MKRRFTRESLVPRRVPGVVGPILVAIAVDFALQTILEPPGTFTRRLVTFGVGALVAFVFGWILGKGVWPHAGRWLASRLLKRALKRGKEPLVFLTDRPDFSLSMTRRVVEVVGFAAGSTVILVAILPLFGVAAATVSSIGALFLLFTLIISFILIPYWVFGRMGMRQVDPVRWLVQPLSRRYADRLRLSNGALLLIAVGATFNLAFRAGASGDEALVEGVLTVAHVVTSVLVTAATGVAFYVRGEHALVRIVEAEAIVDGIRDGRGMTDGEFLPRLKAKE